MMDRAYTMKINLSVLDHLGLNLYSSMPAVLSETVANAWDADAEAVMILIGAHEVTITDDGLGMNHSDVNDKFLTVGYQRRTQPDGSVTPKLEREVMGRKGIGKIGPNDRDYLQKIEFLWSAADDDRFEKLATNATEKAHISPVVSTGEGWRIEGWLGTLFDRESVEDANNVVVLMSRGKLVQEDLLVTVDAGGLFTKYVIGELEAEFLDDDGLPDIVTSDRQHLKENDERYDAITKWFDDALREIGNRWRDWRRDKALDKALAIDVVKEWYDELSAGDRVAAKKLFGRIGTVLKDRPEDETEIYRHIIIAFERLRLRDALSQIDDLPDDADIAAYESVFGGLDDIEAVQYGQIARGRLAIIEKFKDLVPEAQEKVIQEYLFEHLWLLHPSWERPTTSVHMEETVTKELEKVQLTKEAEGRIDIRYATAAGKHIVVELKKADVTVDVFTLARQLRKYREAMLKVLPQQFQIQNPEVELIAVLGKRPSGPSDPAVLEATLRPYNARWVTYNQLIDEALGSYKDYLDANERVSKLQAILDKLDQPLTTAAETVTSAN
jgi:hypothetical protein